MIIVDASYWIGLFFQDDPFHDRSKSLLDDLNKKKWGTIFNSYFVLSEVLTGLHRLCRKNKNEIPTEQYNMIIREFHETFIQSVTEEDLDKTIISDLNSQGIYKFTTYSTSIHKSARKNGDTSFVDCYIVCVAETLGNILGEDSYILTFDGKLPDGDYSIIN